MKKLKYFIIFVGLLVLSGCSERALTFDRVYPDTSILDEVREKRQLEIEEELKNLAVYMMKQSVPPRELQFTSYLDDMGYQGEATQFCWAVKLEECQTIQPIHPYDIKSPFYALNFVRVAANQNFDIGINLADGPTPFPVRVEAYIYDENKNLQLYETIDKPGEIFGLTVPATPGFYTFMFKLYYEGIVEGISYHPHGLRVE